MEVDLGDIFDSFFGGGGGGRGGAGGGRQRQRGPVAGDDLRFDLEVDFQTAVFGGEEKVRIRHLEKCENCGGDGVKVRLDDGRRQERDNCNNRAHRAQCYY
jgi:molecular chaperone DnaJ